MRKTILNIVKNLYEIKRRNIFIVAGACIAIMLLILGGKCFCSNVLNIHMHFKLEIDFLAIYGSYIAIILPVAILIAEKIRDKHNAIISEAYSRATFIYPIIIYFAVNLLLFTAVSEQYFYIVTSFFSLFLIIFLYYRALKMLSNHTYEQEMINLVKEETIRKDLEAKNAHFNYENRVSNYKKYGIYIKQYDYFPVSEYKKSCMYAEDNYQIVKDYKYKTLNKIVPILKDVNKDYIKSLKLSSKEKEVDSGIKPNIIIVLDAVGMTINKNDCWICIYYKEEYEDNANKIFKIIENKIYKLNDSNSSLYIEKLSKDINYRCVESIEKGSSTMLSEALEEYFNNYEDYINELIKTGESNSYEDTYRSANSFYRITTYNFLNNIQKTILDLAEIIVKKDSTKLMNELISFLYEMILYSVSKKELLSIQYLYNTYQYLNDYSMKLTDNSSRMKIKFEIFEILDSVKYEYRNKKNDFLKSVLFICNKTISNIVYDLRGNNELLIKYCNDWLNFIKDIEEDMDRLDMEKPNKNTKVYYDNLEEIYMHFSCNLFATTAYLLDFFEKTKNEEQIEKIMNILSKNLDQNITKILLRTIYMEYNDRMYSWDTMEIQDLSERSGVYNVNTIKYIIHLYCKLITIKDKKYLNVESSYQLSVYADNIISELKELEKHEYIDIFENVKKDVEEQEKQYLRSTNISEAKVVGFKKKFLEEYEKRSRLIKLFKSTNNFKIVKRKKKGTNFIGISNIVEKTYFLEKMPNDRCIIWTNFEENFAYSFIEAEDSKFTEALIKKSQYIDNSMEEYLKSLSNAKLKKSIIFSDYSTIYDIFDFEQLDHRVEKNSFANLYIVINEIKIPVCIIDIPEHGCLYHAYINKIGKYEKSEDDFDIQVGDFSSDGNLLKKCMDEKIEGLELDGEARKNHLLESVNIRIKEYALYNDNDLEALKFDK